MTVICGFPERRPAKKEKIVSKFAAHAGQDLGGFHP